MQEIEFVFCTHKAQGGRRRLGDGVMRFSGLSKGVMCFKRLQSTASSEMDWFLKKSEKRKPLSSTVTLPNEY